MDKEVRNEPLPLQETRLLILGGNPELARKVSVRYQQKGVGEVVYSSVTDHEEIALIMQSETRPTHVVILENPIFTNEVRDTALRLRIPVLQFHNVHACLNID